MFYKTLFTIFICLSQVLPKIAFAQKLAEAELTEGDFFNDFPVVLTATRLKQSKNNSPTATTIIDREMIEASGFTEIVDLLRLAPGMLVNYDSGHVTNAGYQFLFDRYRVRLQILIDGMSVYTPSFGEMPWTQLGITIDDIERIEVIRGPSSASYGPNAMTGVISIITRHSVLDKGQKIKANQGSNGRSEQYLTTGGSNGNFDYRLSLAARKDHGFLKRYDNKDLVIANFRGDYQATNNDVVTISMMHNSGKYQEDNTIDTSVPDHIKSVKQTTFQTKWLHNFSDGDNFTLHYYRQTFTDDNTYLSDPASIFYDIGATTKRDNIEYSYSTKSDGYNLTLGALYRKDNTKSSQYLYNVDRDIETWQAFVNSELYITDSNILNINMLYDDNDTGGETVSPRIAFNHHIDKNHTARISYSESTRSPFVLEEYTNYVVHISGTPTIFASDLSDLKPEHIKSIDLGYIGRLNNNSTEIDFRIYKNWLTDIVLFDSSGGSTGFKQGDAFNVTGFEASLSQRIKNTKVVLNYANTKIDAIKTLFEATAADYETGAPENIISLLMMHDFGNKVNGSLGYYHTSGYQQLCCEIDQQSSRNRVDLTLSKSFTFMGHNSKVKFVLQNATDEITTTRLFNNYHRQGYVSFSLEL